MPKLTLEESLAKNGFLTYRIRGVSMQPMLRQGRDLFTVVPKGSERCKKYDVVLYRRPSDPYVLHRIIEVRPDSYVILGDNCIAKELSIVVLLLAVVLLGLLFVNHRQEQRQTAYIQHCSLHKPSKENSIVTLRQLFQFLHKGIRIAGAARDDQLFIRLDILEGLNQISNPLFWHQTTEEQYVGILFQSKIISDQLRFPNLWSIYTIRDKMRLSLP